MRELKGQTCEYIYMDEVEDCFIKSDAIEKLVMGPDPLTKWQRKRVEFNDFMLPFGFPLSCFVIAEYMWLIAYVITNS